MHIFRRMKGAIVAMSVLASMVTMGSALAEPSAVYLVRHAEKAAADYGLDTRAILIELGRRKMVGGQEDMIVDVALDMVREGAVA